MTPADGSVLTSTDHHPIWDATTTTFTDAINLRVGEDLLGANGQLLAITAERIYDQDLTAYNLQIDGIHTYYAGNTPVLVHNMCPTRQFADMADGLPRRADLKRIGDPNGFAREQGFDSAHAMKESMLPGSTPGSRFDMYQDREGVVWLMDKAGTIVGT